MTEDVFDQDFVNKETISLLTTVLKVRGTKKIMNRFVVSYNVCPAQKLGKRWMVVTGDREDLRAMMYALNAGSLLPQKWLAVA
jgi:hypothetical protein